MSNLITHGECGKAWSGLMRSHCGACHETFSGETAADLHRKGSYSDSTRHCVEPSTVGLVARQKPFGVLWGHPAPDRPFWGSL